MSSKSVQSLVSAIYERYSEISECSTSCSINCSSSDSSSASNTPLSSPNEEKENASSSSSMLSSSCTSMSPSSGISFYIPSVCSPRKTQSGLIMSSVRSLVMSNQCINQVGDYEELEKCCKNVFELDLAKNEFTDWNEIKKILTALKNLRLLNLSHNPLAPIMDQILSNESQLATSIDYFNKEWSLSAGGSNSFDQLQTLILNSCFLDLRIVECLLHRMPNLNELHLASNNYSTVNFSDTFVKDSIKILYLNNNSFSDWYEICKFGKCFPNLENLVLSHNELHSFTTNCADICTSKCFKSIEILILNKLKLTDWSAIDQLRDFVNLKHVRLQNIPLLNDFSDEEKYYLLVGHLDDNIISVNGSKISGEDKENCERKYIRHYLDFQLKPKRYYELEQRHGKLNKLADVCLEANKRVNCKIKYRDQHIYHKIDVRQTVGDFKKQLEKFVGHPSSRFKVFYIDIEACAMSIYGPEELKHVNRCLYSFNIVEGDEFEIDLKPAPIAHVASDNQFQHHHHNSNHHHHHLHHHLHHQHHHQQQQQQQQHNSNYHVNCFPNNEHSVTKPLAIRNRKISESNNSSSSNEYCAKKTRPGSASSSLTGSMGSRQHGSVSAKTRTGKQRMLQDADYCSVPDRLSKSGDAQNIDVSIEANNTNDLNQLLVVRFTSENESEIISNNN